MRAASGEYGDRRLPHRGRLRLAVSAQSLCEFAWVLARGYLVSREDIATAVRRLLDMSNIAHEGQWLGGETFISFDVQSVRLLDRTGVKARLLTTT